MTDAVVAARSESIRKLTNLKSPVPADIDVAQAASVVKIGTIAAASYGDVCRTYASDVGIGGEELGLARGCFAPPAGERARGLVTRLCDVVLDCIQVVTSGCAR